MKRQEPLRLEGRYRGVKTAGELTPILDYSTPSFKGYYTSAKKLQYFKKNFEKSIKSFDKIILI